MKRSAMILVTESSPKNSPRTSVHGKSPTKTPKSYQGPKKDSVSSRIINGVVELAGQRPKGLVSKHAISKFLIIEYHHEINPKVLGNLLRNLVERGYLVQEKQSYRIGPNAPENLRTEARMKRRK